MKRMLYPAFMSVCVLMTFACSESDEPHITGSSDDPNAITAMGSSDSQVSSSSDLQESSSSDGLGYSSSEPISHILCRGACGGGPNPTDLYTDLWNADSEKVTTDTLASEPWNNVGKGKWFVLTDSADGGNSKVIWPVEPGNGYDDTSLDPIVEHCQGLCGHLSLDGEDLGFNPFIELGFYVAGFDSSGTALQADISNWEGICISYSSTLAAALVLDLGDSISRNLLKNDRPLVKLVKSSEGTDKCFQWSDFDQLGWGAVEGGEKISGEEAAKKVVSIRFKIQEKSGVEGNFNIFALGTYTNNK
jgi:hypothetical protein